MVSLDGFNYMSRRSPRVDFVFHGRDTGGFALVMQLFLNGLAGLVETFIKVPAGFVGLPKITSSPDLPYSRAQSWNLKCIVCTCSALDIASERRVQIFPRSCLEATQSELQSISRIAGPFYGWTQDSVWGLCFGPDSQRVLM